MLRNVLKSICVLHLCCCCDFFSCEKVKRIKRSHQQLTTEAADE